MSYADSQYTIRDDIFDLLTNDSPRPTSLRPPSSHQQESSLMTDYTFPSVFMPQNTYHNLRAEPLTKDTAMMNSMDGVVVTEPSTTDTVMTNDQPSSKSSQHIKDGSVTTKPLTADTVMIDDQRSSTLSQDAQDRSDTTATLTTDSFTMDIQPSSKPSQNKNDGVAAAEPLTSDTVMTDDQSSSRDQPSSKLPQNINDNNLATESSTTLATTDDELFADFLVDNVDDFVSPVPSTLLPYFVPCFQRPNHQQPQAPTPAVPIFERQQFIHLMHGKTAQWLTSLGRTEIKPTNKLAMVDPFFLEITGHTQNSFNKFLAKYPHLRSTSYMDARHQFWRACGCKAELAPSVGAAELYAWEAAPDSVPAPSPATTADLKQARELLATKPDPRRGRPHIYSFNAENDAARRSNAANPYDAARAAAAAAAAEMMPPPPRPTRPSNPAPAAHHIPRPIFGNLDPALLPNSHIDDMRYNLLNSIGEAREIVPRSLANPTSEFGRSGVIWAEPLAVARLEYAAYRAAQEIKK